MQTWHAVNMLKLIHAQSHRRLFNKWTNFRMKQIQINRISVLKNECKDKNTTIFALSSGHGKCGVAVVRVSGPFSSPALKVITQSKELPAPRQASIMKLYHPQTKEQIDRGLILWFPGMFYLIRISIFMTI